VGVDERGDHVRKERIDQILDIVGIPKEVRNRSIGGTLAGGLVIRGLSGGERKRLALACAVAMKPSIIFLDEITSGLDSENAVLAIELIKNMCVSMNVAAVVVIHQPSYEVFSHFDRLVLLQNGKCVYNGLISGISSFYDNIGRSMPEIHLIPDDIIRAETPLDYSNRIFTNELVESSGLNVLQDVKNRKKPSAFFMLKTVLTR
jgi:ABC-type multidrug transport system ATPase subunit